MTPPRPLLAFLVALLLVGGGATASAQGATAQPPVAAEGAGHDDDHHDDHAHDEDAHAHDDARDNDDAHDHGDAHDHDHAHGAGVAGTRLLVAEADGATLMVLDLASGAELARFGTPGPGTVVELPDAQLAVVLHSGEDRVTFVHSGLTAVDHGDHADLVEGRPYVLQTVNLGPRPTQAFAFGDDLAVFHDGDGSVAWLDRRLLGVSLDFAFLDGRASGPGAVAVVGDHAFVAEAEQGLVDVIDRAGTNVATFEGCPGAGGPAAWASGVAFGCDDGVLLVEARADGTFVSHALAVPAGAADGVRVGALVGDEGSATLVGALGQGIAVIDPAARTLAPVALPAAPVAMRFAEAGARLVVLTADGALHALDPAGGAVLRSVAVLEALETGGTPPALAVLGEHAYVADPRRAEVVEVHLDDLEVERRLPLPFAPGGVAGLAIPGAARH